MSNTNASGSAHGLRVFQDVGSFEHVNAVFDMGYLAYKIHDEVENMINTYMENFYPDGVPAKDEREILQGLGNSIMSAYAEFTGSNFTFDDLCEETAVWLEKGYLDEAGSD